MEKINVRVCDMCKKVISKDKCDFCGCDLCDNCFLDRSVMVNSSDDIDEPDDYDQYEDNCVFPIAICKKCSRRLFWKKKPLLDLKEDKELIDLLLDKLRKRCLAESIGKKKSKEDDKEE